MLTRGKLSNQTGCNIETIRYYEKTGLIPEPKRSASGYRSYDDEHVRLLNFIQRAKSLGFSADQIRGLIELNDSGKQHTRAEVKALTQSHIDDISHKIKDLQKISSRLTQISSFCDGSTASAESCPILGSLFEE
jgi:MerR family mercuric resistance operon transcriptional regulator